MHDEEGIRPILRRLNRERGRSCRRPGEPGRTGSRSCRAHPHVVESV